MSDARALMLDDDELNRLEGLFSFGAIYDIYPDRELLDIAIGLFKDPDPDVRGQAVFAAATHWGDERTFKPLLEMLRSEQDDYVQARVVIALSRIAQAYPDLIKPVIASFAGFCRRDDVDVKEKRDAWTAAKELTLGQYLRPEPSTPLSEIHAWFEKWEQGRSSW